MGYGALFNNTTGLYNNAMGFQALNKNTTGSNNTAVGIDALYNNTIGNRNTAMGQSSLYSNTTGIANTAIGVDAMNASAVADSNTAVGFRALYVNTTGVNNVSLGARSMISNTSGDNNVATGYDALRLNTTGNRNTALGVQALYANLDANNNVGLGYQAMWTNASAINNTAVGYQTLLLQTTGNRNVAVGYQAGSSFASNSNNTFVGNAADASINGLTNATALGNGAAVNASNKIRLGNTAVTVIEGQVAYTFPSDGRFKTNVQEDVKGLEFIMKLRPVTYNFDRVSYSKYIGEKQSADYIQTLNTLSSTRQTGFIAQEMEKAVFASGYKGFDGITVPQGEHQAYGIAYATLVVPLVKAVQQQQVKIEALERNTAAGRELIEQLQKEIEGLKKMVNEKTTAGN